MDLSNLITQLFAALTRGSIFFLLASGLTLVFGITKVINFAHGSFYALSMYITYSLTKEILLLSPFAPWLNVILALISVVGLGVVLEVILLRRLYKEEHLMQLLLTFALVYILSDSMKLIWGTIPKSVSPPDFFAGSIRIAGGIVTSYNLFVIAAGIGIGIGLWAILQRSRFGIVARAAASDAETTRALGIDVNAVYTGVFAMGIFLAGVAGTLNLPLSSAALGIDVEMTILAFVIVIIGGVGSVGGAAIAALIVGLVETFGIMYIPRLTIALIYIIMVVMLIVRPFGILGRVIR
jgi:branched-subunit amino acid ABC-type transport system permease component